MEFFPDGFVVRLRSCIRGGLYLYARGDGLGVVLSPRRSSPNTGWEVRRFQREGTDCFILCSSATGRCLASAESADQRSRRAAAVHCDYVERLHLQRAATWRGTWAGLRHGDVILRDFFSRRLCAEAQARYGNDVFVQMENRGKTKVIGFGVALASHWFVEAALPLSLRPSPKPLATDPQCSTSLCVVPRLNRVTAASARLPILGTRNEFLGYLPACCITGLLKLLYGTGRGEMLQADASVVGGEAGNGQLVTALAFLAGRGKGITTLPLNLEEQDVGAVLDGDDHGEPSANGDVEPEPAGVVVVGADDLVQADEAQEEFGGQEEHAALDEQAHQQAAQAVLQANADAVALQEVDEDAGDDIAQQIDDTLQYLQETYEVMESKHRYISYLVEERRVTAEQAAARRDWSVVDKVHRTLHKKIQQAISVYEDKDKEAAGFRDSLVRLGVRRPPSPPLLLRTHPAHLLTGRRG